MNPVQLRRLVELEMQAARLTTATSIQPVDEIAIIAEWRRLQADPPVFREHMSPDIAAMTDQEATDAWRRLCWRGRP